MKKLYCTLLVLLLTLGNNATQSIAQNHTTATKRDSRSLKKWADMSSEMLWQEGNRMMTDDELVDSAMLMYSIVAERYKNKSHLSKDESKIYSACCNNLGYCYLFYYYDYNNALNYLLLANESNVLNNTNVLLNLGCIYDFYAQCYPVPENINRSNEFFKRALRSAIETRRWRSACSAFNNIWNFGFSRQTINKNRDVLNDFTLIRLDTTNLEYQYSWLLYHAVRAIERKDYSAACGFLRRQLDISEDDINPERTRCQVYWSLSQVFELTGNQDSVYRYAKIIDRLAAEHRLKDFEVDACDMLNRYYQQSGSQELADAYRLKYYQKRDSLLMQHKLNSIDSNYLLYNIRTISQEVETLKQKRHFQTVILLLMLTIAIISTAFFILFYRKNRQLRQRNETLYNKMQQQLEQEQEQGIRLKYQASRLEDEQKDIIYEKILLVMQQTQEICREGFSLEQLAQLCDNNYKVISQVINERYGNSFAIMLSEYRVKEACRRINDCENYGNLTLEAIATSVGFKARSGFFRAFKRVTGLSPSEYQRLARKNDNTVASC